MTTIRVRARVATTHPIPAYGGIALSEDAVRQIADQLRSGSIPMTYSHDLARPATSSVISAGVEQLEDGQFAAWAEFDVDEAEWAEFEREKAELGAPGGMSFTTAQAFASRGDEPYGLTVAADASHFDPHSVLAATAETWPHDLSLEVSELFQFSWLPDPTVVIGIAQTILASVPGNILSSYLYDFGRRLKAGRQTQGKATTMEIKVHRTPNSRTTQIKLPISNDEQFRLAVAAIPGLLEAEGQTHIWEDGDWNTLPPANPPIEGE